MADATAQLQKLIVDACVKNGSSEHGSDVHASIRLEKGDYGIQSLLIPRNARIRLYSKDRVRLLFLGKRNRPMFTLEENSMLFLEEKIEIYYNTNNIQEVSKLMLRVPQSSRAEISNRVKVSLFSLKQ